MKGNEARVVFFLHPVDQLKDGQVSKVKPLRSPVGVLSFLLFGLLLGLGVLLYILLSIGVKTSQQGLVSTGVRPTMQQEYEESGSGYGDGEYDEHDDEYYDYDYEYETSTESAVIERTTEVTSSKTRGNGSTAETKAPNGRTLPGTFPFV